MNKNLRTDKYENTPITFMTWNCDGATREQAHAQSCWEARVWRIIALIASILPDIICFQEITGSKMRSKFISSLNKIGYEVIYAKRNSSQMCTNLLIAYKPDLFYPTKVKNIQLQSDDKYTPGDFSNPNGYGTNLLLVYFLRITDGKSIPGTEFAIGNTHFPMDKQSRIDCSTKLAEWFKNVKNINTKYIICGDLNSYKGNGYDEQIKIIEDATSRVEDEGMCGDIKITGSFVGFEHDRFKFNSPDFDPLDHIMYNSKFVKSSNTRYDGRTMLTPEPPLLSTRDLPSDHLPKIVDINFL
ncbi:hypothetical protein QLL95_gp0526 [Cotonvirus japonicus]|uniref:Endonuclease/exonuclease/phosphatase domain-containing protein n=1 Tax=Cotonvirus japonicus TaxID=2811091 RepID=A0ABM7NU59_9VIRU|nr:hypothetical protein QLL95_gp0526 [Cotonvirus japonicus]BCS83597.1 hypothetical protein [Cotonvirus japonicus]